MKTISLQMMNENTGSNILGGMVIAFMPEPDLPGISTALINTHQWEQVRPFLRDVPCKIDESGTGKFYLSFNNATW